MSHNTQRNIVRILLFRRVEDVIPMMSLKISKLVDLKNSVSFTLQQNKVRLGGIIETKGSVWMMECWANYLLYFADDDDLQEDAAIAAPKKSWFFILNSTIQV